MKNIKDKTIFSIPCLLIALLLATSFQTASLAQEAENTASNSPCPQGMSYIPPGEFLKGWDNGEPDERPEVVEFTNAYCVDEYEYPNRKGEMPMADVAFDQAMQLCADQGKRVCHELEWERACRGPSGTIYTNTQDYKQIQCNLNSPGAQAAGDNPECVNDYGVFDMTGNLWEWVDGIYGEDNPWPLIKGGAFKKGPLFSSCYARFTQPPDAQSNGVGFRCCADPLINESEITYAQDCSGYNGPFIHDDILALKQNPDVKFILFVDAVQDPANRPENPESGSYEINHALALVIFNDNSSTLISNPFQTKDKWKQSPGKWESVKNFIEMTEYWTNNVMDGRTLYSNYWNCSAIRSYIYYNKKEYWSDSPQFGSMEMATLLFEYKMSEDAKKIDSKRQ